MNAPSRATPALAASGAVVSALKLDIAALERAFEDTTNEARRYLDVLTGTITVLAHGMTDAATFAAFDQDERHLLIEPASRRQQYRWMQEYIATLDDFELAVRLKRAVVGKGAFSRFQAVLADREGARRAWRAFRIDRLHAVIAAWLDAHGIAVTVPFVAPDRALEFERRRLASTAVMLGARELVSLVELARFLVITGQGKEMPMLPTPSCNTTRDRSGS